MSEDAPQFQPADESQRIEDPEKAHAMALAGKNVRDEAHHLNGIIREWQENKLDETGDLQNQASKLEFDANQLEEEAGRQYDAEHSSEFKLPMSADELIEVLSALRTYDDSGEGEEYIDQEVIWNEEWGKKNSELYGEIYDKLSHSEQDDLRSIAAIGINHIFVVNRPKAIEVMQRLLTDESPRVLEALCTQMDFKLVFDKETGIENNLSLLKGYADAMRRKREKEQERPQ